MQSLTTLLKWIRVHQHPQMMTVCKCADTSKRVRKYTHSALSSLQMARKDVSGWSHIENTCAASSSSETQAVAEAIRPKVRKE